MKTKIGFCGVALAVGVGVITGIVYLIGKVDGKSEAYGEVAKVLEEAITEVKVEKE